MDTYETIHLNELRRTVSKFVNHRLWYRILLAYKLRPLWTIAELTSHIGVSHTQNILATSQGTLHKLGYKMLPVNKGTRGSKYYLKKLEE